MGETAYAEYARIRLPKSKNEDVPRSLTSGGITIQQGGTGTLINDPAKTKRFKRILGDMLETSKTPFAADKGPGRGFTIDPGRKE